MSTSGSLLRCLDGRPRPRTPRSPAASRPSVLTEPQLQAVASLTASRAAEMPDGHQRGRTPVHPARDAHRRLRHEAPGEERGDHDHDQRNPEQPMPAEVLQDHTGSRRSPIRRRHRGWPTAARCSRDLLARKLVADDAKGEREDAAGGALERAPHDHGPPTSWRRLPAACRGQGSRRSTAGTRPLPYMSPRATQDRGADRGRQQVGRSTPRHARLRGVQIVLDRR